MGCAGSTELDAKEKDGARTSTITTNEDIMKKVSLRLDSSVAALSATLALVGAVFACLRVQVMEPSTWVRNECKFSSFASAAACRMSRRAPLLSFVRGAGWPGARVCDGTLDALFIGNVTKF